MKKELEQLEQEMQRKMTRLEQLLQYVSFDYICKCAIHTVQVLSSFAVSRTGLNFV